MKLKRSNDRKVTNAVSKNGKTPAIANTFGLPAGKDFSCPGATSICESVCYAGKLEKLYKGVKAVLLHNWELLRNADMDTMLLLIDEMIVDFIADCEKKNAPKLFRIHWDGDFFSETYTHAWRLIIMNHPDVKFWVYTRVKSSAEILQGLENLSVYYSTDSENKDIAQELSGKGVKLAYLATTFAMAKEDMLNLIGKSGVKCPENNKKIPLISVNGSACVTCGQCVHERNDILFSASKK